MKSGILSLGCLVIGLFCFPVLPAAAQAVSPFAAIAQVSFLERNLAKIPGLREVHAGDFNADGYMDLVLTTSDPALLWISYGREDGRMSLPKKVGFGSGSADVLIGSRTVVGDFDGDGRQEILSVQRRSIQSNGKAELLLSIVRQQEGSAFTESRIPLSLDPDFVLLAGGDFDSNGVFKLLLGKTGSTLLHTVSGHGQQITISSPLAVRQSRGGLGNSVDPLSATVVLDVDDDGENDMVRLPNGEMIFLHDQGVAFRQPDRGRQFENPLFPDVNRPAGPGQFNADKGKGSKGPGRPERSGVFRHRRTTLSPSLLIDLPSGEDNIASGDLNGDGLDDVVLYGTSPGIRVLVNTGSGFRKGVELPLAGKRVKAVSIVDLDRDGRSDLVCLIGTEVRLLMNISQHTATHAQ
jgi:hypothetical protein